MSDAAVATPPPAATRMDDSEFHMDQSPDAGIFADVDTDGLSIEETVGRLFSMPGIPEGRDDLSGIAPPTTEHIATMVQNANKNLDELADRNPETREILDKHFSGSDAARRPALCVMLYTMDTLPIPVYKWVNAWLNSTARCTGNVAKHIGPFFVEYNKAMKVLPEVTTKAARAIKFDPAKSPKLFGAFNDYTEVFHSSKDVNFWGIASFTQDDAVMSSQDFYGGPEDYAIVFVCAQLRGRLVSLLSASPLEAEIQPSTPSGFRVLVSSRASNKLHVFLEQVPSVLDYEKLNKAAGPAVEEDATTSGTGTDTAATVDAIRTTGHEVEEDATGTGTAATADATATANNQPSNGKRSIARLFESGVGVGRNGTLSAANPALVARLRDEGGARPVNALVALGGQGFGKSTLLTGLVLRQEGGGGVAAGDVFLRGDTAEHTTVTCDAWMPPRAAASVDASAGGTAAVPLLVDSKGDLKDDAAEDQAKLGRVLAAMGPAARVVYVVSGAVNRPIMESLDAMAAQYAMQFGDGTGGGGAKKLALRVFLRTPRREGITADDAARLGELFDDFGVFVAPEVGAGDPLQDEGYLRAVGAVHEWWQSAAAPDRVAGLPSCDGFASMLELLADRETGEVPSVPTLTDAMTLPGLKDALTAGIAGVLANRTIGSVAEREAAQAAGDAAASEVEARASFGRLSAAGRAQWDEYREDALRVAAAEWDATVVKTETERRERVVDEVKEPLMRDETRSKRVERGGLPGAMGLTKTVSYTVPVHYGDRVTKTLVQEERTSETFGSGRVNHGEWNELKRWTTVSEQLL